MKKLLLSTALLAAGFVSVISASAHDRDDNDFDSAKPLTIAVFGDWPYNQNLLDNAPAEWLRLTIDPRKPQAFSWVNVPYCKEPLASCQ